MKRKILKSFTLKDRMKKSRRIVRPLFMGEMEYKGYPYTGLEAFCLNRGEKRIFNVDKIWKSENSPKRHANNITNSYIY